MGFQQTSNRCKSAGQRTKLRESGAFVVRRAVVNLTGQSGSGVARVAPDDFFLGRRAFTASETGFLDTDRVDADPTDKG